MTNVTMSESSGGIVGIKKYSQKLKGSDEFLTCAGYFFFLGFTALFFFASGK